MSHQRPPHGLLPRNLWLSLLEVPTEPSADETHERATMILGAISRYRFAGAIPPDLWFDELSSINQAKA